MIIAFACSDQALNRLADTSVEALSRALWIDLLNATPEEIDRVQKVTGLDVPTQAEVSEIETSSRLASRNGALYLSMPLVNLSDDGPHACRPVSFSLRSVWSRFGLPPTAFSRPTPTNCPVDQTRTIPVLMSSLA